MLLIEFISAAAAEFKKWEFSIALGFG